MSLLKLILGSRRQSLAFKIDGLPPTDPAIAHWLTGGRESSAGTTVTDRTAMSLSAVFAAVNLLSSIVASLPLHVYRRRGKDREIADNHPVDRVLHSRANEEMTAFQARRCLEFNRLLFGRAAAEIGHDAGGNVRSLWPLEGWRIAPTRDQEGRLVYAVDGARKLLPSEVIYVPLISQDGVCGQSFLDYAVESLGLGLSAQEFAARFFGNGARPGGLLIHEGNVEKKAREELRESWHRSHGGPSGSHRVGVLWGGWKYDRSAGSIAPEEAQLLETRRFTTEEVARWFGIPPHFLAELSRATFSNIEEQGQNFVTYCLGPILTAYEQEFDTKLLDPPKLYSKHNFGGLLRGNSQARSAFYRELFGIGVLSINEIRQLEDWNPIGEAGDIHLVPLNMAPAEDLLQEEQEEQPVPPAQEPVPPQAPPPPTSGPPVEENPQQPPDNPEEEGMRRRIAAGLMSRMLGVERTAVLRAAREPGQFLRRVEDFYAAWESKLAEAILPIAALYRGACNAAAIAAALARAHVSRSQGELLDIAGEATASQLAGKVQELTQGWQSRAEEFTLYLEGGKCAS